VGDQIHPTKETELKLSDSRHFLKTIVGVCLIAAPLALLASALVSPPIRNNEADQLAVIAQESGRYYLFTLLILIGTALLVPVFVGFMYLVRERAATLGNIGGSLAILGTLIAVGDAVSQLFVWQMVAPEADRQQMVALLTRFDNAPQVAIMFMVGGLSTIAGMTLLSIALYRAGAAPAWVAAGIAVGAILNIAGFMTQNTWLVIVSSVVLLVSLGWTGRSVLGGSDEDWANLPIGRTVAATALHERSA
jgi:hypothetical protein